jgi:hypothetical protein
MYQIHPMIRLFLQISTAKEYLYYWIVAGSMTLVHVNELSMSKPRVDQQEEQQTTFKMRNKPKQQILRTEPRIVF